MKVVNLRRNPEYKEKCILYFQEKWATPDSLKVYEDSISRSIAAKNPLPIWYLLEDNAEIIGCAGVITNDFISCGDLYPWLCALYIEESHRGNFLGKRLISQIKYDASKIGFKHIYLCTDHVGYYEKCGFKYITEGYHPWGESSRVYESSTI